MIHLVSSPDNNDRTTAEFIQGSSKTSTQELDGLAQQLQQSASFEDKSRVWLNDNETDMWKF